MDKVKDLLDKCNADEAIVRLTALINQDKENDNYYYLRGNAYRKKGNWQEAIQNYLEAIALNANSPAVEAHQMMIEILEFYNKDMFNQ
ncbi:MAG: tetratricopeptide repeat protein [Bacteroidaceae bacterium]